tara:strand:- start:1572 stop:1988 length:417 start_codon:yes stop_codon:yes gene_type:complete
LTDKLSDKDKIDWENFLNNPSKIEVKDVDEIKKFNSNIEKSIDLHGYTLDDANKKIYSFIKDCFEKKVNIINIITGKGLRSKNTNDPYQSKDLSILKYSIPNFIKNNDELMEIILKIDEDAIDSPLKGNFKIELKRNE